MELLNSFGTHFALLLAIAGCGNSKVVGTDLTFTQTDAEGGPQKIKTAKLTAQAIETGSPSNPSLMDETWKCTGCICDKAGCDCKTCYKEKK